ncbi:MAG: hypothetical protein M0R34_09715, partial [Candidatus Marinimicrobia bacterium]|nr:hypothetical protein [Candidatus Neomarinimicrobiota bacterium]
LKRFNPEETKAYIEYRLKVAGRNDSIFTDSAIEEIYKYSQGTPRIINNICDLSLVIGFGKHLDSLDNSVISGIIDSER